MTSCLPKRAKRIQSKAAGFRPEHNEVVLDDGRSIGYGQLVVAAGIQLDWKKIEGLEATLGKHGVTNNYRKDLAPYTWECIQAFNGGKALFTQPVMPIKCAGAPQKILYMAADPFRRRGLKSDLSFFTPGPSMFGVPFYAKALDKVVAEYGITPKFGHTLVAVDGPAKRATFETKLGDTLTQVALPFDLPHVVPPQSAPDFIEASPLPDASGWVSIDKHTLRHTKYENMFGLGDCTTTPNSKTAAVVRAQASVVASQLIHALERTVSTAKYDGYASCPLTTSVGKIMLAEFAYDGLVTPSFPLDPQSTPQDLLAPQEVVLADLVLGNAARRFRSGLARGAVFSRCGAGVQRIDNKTARARARFAEPHASGSDLSLPAIHHGQIST